MVLDFPILADYAVLMLGDQTVYITHGHHYNEQNPPALAQGDVLLCGHTHVPCRHEHETFTYLNPGSSSIPKDDSHPSYMLWENGVFTWYDLMTGQSYIPD